jgi:hypothetical protein
MECACRVMTASRFATFVFTELGGMISWILGEFPSSGGGGSLKAWVASLLSIRYEKEASRRDVRTLEKAGESMRSDVSSRRRRRSGDAGSGDVERGEMPDSWRT